MATAKRFTLGSRKQSVGSVGGGPDSPRLSPASRKRSFERRHLGFDGTTVAAESRQATVFFFDPKKLLRSKTSSTWDSKSNGWDVKSNAESEFSFEESEMDDRERGVASPTFSYRSARTPRSAPTRQRSASADTSGRLSPRAGAGAGDDEYIKVAIRIRPLLTHNKGERDVLLVNHIDSSMTLDQSPGKDGDAPAPPASPSSSTKRTFKYDYILDSRGMPSDVHFASQESVYAVLGDRVVKSAMAGYNACLFAYGQTGTGKTHTVLGRPRLHEDRGLLPRILEALFTEVMDSDSVDEVTRKSDGNGSIRISYLEIFNENIYDLLVPPNKKTCLQVRYHPAVGVLINDLSEVTAGSLAEAQEHLEFGTRMRSIASTAMNNRSSRSHTVFTFRLEQSSSDGDTQLGQVQLVDLAGREQEKSSVDNRERLRERQFINTSLFHLSTCIMNLSRRHGRRNLPEWAFRNSKLTLLLANSLGGNSRTGMVAAVSPAASDVDETLSTLRFADAVKKIKTSVSVNKLNKTSLVLELQQEIAMLRQKMQQSSTRDLAEQVQELEAICANFREALSDGRARSKHLAAERSHYLRDLGLTVGKEGLSFALGRPGAEGEEQSVGVPYLVNLSEDPCLEGCLMYFLTGPDEVTVGSEEGNRVLVHGLGVKQRHCIIRNDSNKQLFLQVLRSENDSEREQPRVSLNGRPIKGNTEIRHQDHLVLGHRCAFRVIIPLSAQRLRDDKSAESSHAELAELEQALTEIEDFGSHTLQHVRQYVEELEECVGVEASHAFVRQLHHAVKLVEEANQITQEVRSEEGLVFSLQVLPDLWSAATNAPEIAVAVLFVVKSNPPTPAQRPRRFSKKLSGLPCSDSSPRSANVTTGGAPQDVQQPPGACLRFIWSLEKFEGRLQAMRDIYDEKHCLGLDAVRRRLDMEPYSDPWKEIGAGEVQMLIDGVKCGHGFGSTECEEGTTSCKSPSGFAAASSTMALSSSIAVDRGHVEFEVQDGLRRLSPWYNFGLRVSGSSAGVEQRLKLDKRAPGIHTGKSRIFSDQLNGTVYRSSTLNSDASALPEEMRSGSALARENERLRRQLEELQSARDRQALCANHSDHASELSSVPWVAHDTAEGRLAWERKARAQEDKLKRWAQQLERKEQTLREMEEVQNKLRHLQEQDLQTRAKSIRVAEDAQSRRLAA